MAHCSKCKKPIGTKCNLMCYACHAKEVERIHKYDTPTTPEVSTLTPYQPPPHLLGRGRQERVIRKGSTMS